jgi:DHA2 family multidrug resistance protein-like MFS transporter
VLGAGFVRRQRGLAEPLIDVGLFRVPAFSAALVVFVLNAVVMFGASFFSAQYLQLVLGLSPLRAGLLTLPGAISVTAGTMVAPALARRARPAEVMTGGLLVCATGFLVLALVGYGGLPFLVAGSVLTALGAGPLVTLVPDAIVGAAPPERAGAAASISSTAAEFGGALGLAVLGSVGVFVYRSAMAGAGAGTALVGVPAEAAGTARETLGGAVAVARRLAPDAGGALLEAARGAYAVAFVDVALICAVLMVVAAGVMAAAAGRRPARERPVRSQLMTATI